MKTRLPIFFLCLVGYQLASAQSPDNPTYNQLISKKEVLVKTIDHKFPPFGGPDDSFETRIRKVIVGNEKRYFLQFMREKGSLVRVASISSQELPKIISAVEQLKTQCGQDEFEEPDYIENRITTREGITIGYFTEKAKCKWFISINETEEGFTIFRDSPGEIEIYLNLGKSQIEKMAKTAGK